MSSDLPHTPSPPFIRLLNEALDAFSSELMARAHAAGYEDIRPGHGCVFGNIEPDGSRLTDLAERALMTKQSVGEVATDLERLGYVERTPDPRDGRAKIIHLTERGRAAQAVGRELIDELEQEWAERFGAERIAVIRQVFEAIAAERQLAGASLT
jgi:DNA-binding MarR family transcriptional regulator